MLTLILTTIGIAAVTAWLGFLAVRYLLPQVPNPVTAISASRQAARERITRDPLDYIRAWVARMAPARMKVERQVEAAQNTIELADARKTQLLTGFKDEAEPSFGFKITALILFVAWLIAVTAVFIIDVPIVAAVSGGNIFNAVVGTALLIVLPVISSVLLGHFFVKWRREEMHTVLFSALLIGIVASVFGLVWYLTTLAPMRAEVEYADKIREVEQQLVEYREDGDQNAINFAELNLKELEAQQARSAEWNTVLVPLAATAEFATGFFVPLAIPILLLADVESSRRKAERAQIAARNRVNAQRARQYARLARQFQRLGIPQLALQQHLGAVAAENRPDQAGGQVARNLVAQELADQAPTLTTDAPNAANSAPLNPTMPNRGTPANQPRVPEPVARVKAPDGENGDAAGAGANRRAPVETAPIAVLDRDELDISDSSFNLN